MDPLALLIFGLPMLVVVLLVIRLVAGGSAYASNSKRQALESRKESLNHQINMVEQEIRDLDRQIAEYETRR